MGLTGCTRAPSLTPMTSCRDCENFKPENRVPCWFYNSCKAGKPLSEKPSLFKEKDTHIDLGVRA